MMNISNVLKFAMAITVLIIGYYILSDSNKEQTELDVEFTNNKENSIYISSNTGSNANAKTSNNVFEVVNKDINSFDEPPKKMVESVESSNDSFEADLSNTKLSDGGKGEPSLSAIQIFQKNFQKNIRGLKGKDRYLFLKKSSVRESDEWGKEAEILIKTGLSNMPAEFNFYEQVTEVSCSDIVCVVKADDLTYEFLKKAQWALRDHVMRGKFPNMDTFPLKNNQMGIYLYRVSVL